jgi:hypothetical protein
MQHNYKCKHSLIAVVGKGEDYLSGFCLENCTTSPITFVKPWEYKATDFYQLTGSGDRQIYVLEQNGGVSD